MVRQFLWKMVLGLSLTGLGVGSPAWAQQSGATTSTLRAQLVDSISGQPVPGVLVRAEVGGDAVSDRLGRVMLSDLPPGVNLLALITQDCQVTWARVDLAAGVSREVELRVPPDFKASAEVERDRQAERRRNKGRILVAEEIDRLGARTAADLVHRLAPTMVGRGTGQVGESAVIHGRAPTAIIAEEGPVLLLDGVRVRDVSFVLDNLTPSEIDTLEVLPGSAGGWEFGAPGASGVIRVVRRRGVVTGTPESVEVTACSVSGLPIGR